MKHKALSATFNFLGLSTLLAATLIGRDPASAQGQSPPAKGHFLEVGKSYTFGYSTGKRSAVCWRSSTPFRRRAFGG